MADRLEGDVSGIVMMIEFETKEAANTFYHSEEYQAAKAIREECSDTDLMIAEGVEDSSRQIPSTLPSPLRYNLCHNRGLRPLLSNHLFGQ